MPESILKTKILEKYESIRYFCFINDIPYETLLPYCRDESEINSMKYKTLNKVCDGLNCDPSDIGYTKEYWYELCKNGKLRITDNPLHSYKQSK